LTAPRVIAITLLCMKTRWLPLFALAATIFLAGCASTDSELTQKEKDKMAREQARRDQQQQRAQEKAMREATQSNQRRGTR
jgi:starvation-inducible outer membrane lipoprotein